MKKTLHLSIIIVALFFINACDKDDVSNTLIDKGGNAKVVLDWYRLQLRILRERNSALNGAYTAYIGIGTYEAIRYGTKNSVSLSTKLYQMPAMPAKVKDSSYHWEVSANAALASLVRSYYTGLTPANLASIDSLENAWNQLLTADAGESFNRSQSFGRSVATAVYNWSLTDNFNPSNMGYVPPVFPGSWVPTPPAFLNGVQPFLSTARPLLESDQTIVAPAIPNPYSEDPTSAFYKMAKNVYDISKTLTDEQKTIALTWVDQGNGVGATTHGHELSILTQALEQKQASLAMAAESYAKGGIAERESIIVCFKSKYTYNLVRPVTYIRKFIDTGWFPFIVTPPHPEYPAAHAFVTGAFMQAITAVLGDNMAITDHTYDFRGWTPRQYTSLFKTAEEAGISRLYGGIHYQPSIDVALSLAKDLGKSIGELKLTE